MANDIDQNRREIQTYFFDGVSIARAHKEEEEKDAWDEYDASRASAVLARFDNKLSVNLLSRAIEKASSNYTAITSRRIYSTGTKGAGVHHISRRVNRCPRQLSVHALQSLQRLFSAIVQLQALLKRLTHKYLQLIFSIQLFSCNQR
uniref:Uncharacterized protein n=1 Tax=Trichogramma kaykai TaxID=54128 RepID=A0ABD2VST6_9HYME